MADPVFTLGAELTPGSLNNICRLLERGSWGQAIVDMFHPPVVGRAMFELANDAGTIGPRINSYSQPGTAIQLTALCSGVNYALFFGRITDVYHTSDLGKRTVIFDAVDDWDRLQQLRYTTALYSGTPVMSLFTELMSMSAVRSFVVNSGITENVGYAWYRDHSAPEALFELVQAADYQLVVDGDGTYRLAQRGWSAFNAASTFNFDTRSWLFSFDSHLSRETIYNRVRVSGQERVFASDLRTLTYLPTLTPITLPASSSYGFWG